MPYYLIDDFSKGMDRRRLTQASPGGTVYEIRNGFVNRGGEIEKRRTFYELTGIDPDMGANQEAGIGPIPTFDRSAALFIVGGVGAWQGGVAQSQGGGSYKETGSLTFGSIVEASLSAKDFMYCGAVANYADQQIIGAQFQTVDKADFDVEQYDAAFTAGNFIPDTLTRLINRDGNLPSSDADPTPQFVSKFSSLIGVKPNVFQILKSQTGDPTLDSGTGYGAIETRGQGVEIGRPISCTFYYDQLAVFGESGIQFWNIDSDPANWSLDRVIGNEHLAGARSVLPYADGDVLYLTEHGIRSLQARDSSNFAATSDLGSPIDEIIIEALNQDSKDFLRRAAIALIHPSLGQAWFCINDEIFVLSRYPSAGVLGWSIYDTPDTADQFSQGDAAYYVNSDPALNRLNMVQDACPIGNTVTMRMGSSQLFSYGHPLTSSSSHYSTESCQVTTHYYGLDDPFTLKQGVSIDLTVAGTWVVEVSTDPDNEGWEEIATVTGSTHYDHSIDLPLDFYLIAIRLTNTTAEQGKVSQIVVHYDTTEERD